MSTEIQEKAKAIRVDCLTLDQQFEEATLSAPTTATVWPVHGLHGEFASITTTPQQDHKKDGSGITIHPIKDLRAQPWNEYIRANVHHLDIHHLPSLKADRKEVKEYLYLVLANNTYSQIATDKPWLVCTTIDTFNGTGKDLRRLDGKDWTWNSACPAVWTDVYRHRHHVTEEERKALGEHLRVHIEPLLLAEREASGLPSYSSIMGEKKKIRSLKKSLKKFMCLGNVAATLPEYKEKGALEM